MGRGVVVGLALAGVLGACAGPSLVETSVREAFRDCMAKRGYGVGDVEVVVGEGRHVERFEWNRSGEPTADRVGEECEDAALEMFEVSRT